jgi:hypothetical protein
MATSFSISKITVNYPDGSNLWTPLVYKTNGNTNEVTGYSPSGSLTLEDPISIHQTAPSNGNSFITVATSRGQYQIYWNNGDETNPYQILLQSLTSSNPYPDNQYNLWMGSASSQDFTLHIDLTQLSKGNGISLISNN